MHARQSRREAHEDEAHEHLVLERHESVARGVQPREAVPVGHADEAPVEAVGPGVIGTGDAAAAVAARTVEQPRGAMPADVMESAHRAILAAQHQHRLPEELEGVEVPRLRHVAQVAHELPAAAEDAIALALEEFRIPVDPRG